MTANLVVIELNPSSEHRLESDMKLFSCTGLRRTAPIAY